jgi:hypothetical protein
LSAGFESRLSGGDGSMTSTAEIRNDVRITPMIFPTRPKPSGYSLEKSKRVRLMFA